MGLGAEKRKRNRLVRSPSPSMASTGASSRKSKRRASVSPYIPDELHPPPPAVQVPPPFPRRLLVLAPPAASAPHLLRPRRQGRAGAQAPGLLRRRLRPPRRRVPARRPVRRHPELVPPVRHPRLLRRPPRRLLEPPPVRLQPGHAPVTRLPTPGYYSQFVGFYAHVPSGEYRVLTSYLNWPRTQYSINAAGSGEVRCIGLLPSVEEGYEFQTPAWSELPIPALIRGSLHWPPQKCDDHKILAFDTLTEVFWWMRPPPVTRENMSMLEMEGELAMFSCCKDVSMVELWLLQDYENQDWVCKYRTDPRV